MRFRDLDGKYQEPTSRGIKTAKVIIVLSFILPYLVDWLNEEGYQQLAIYAPIWIAVSRGGYSYIGPSGMALAMIFNWMPYVYVGYQSYMFAQGRYSSVGRYVLGVVFVTLIAFALTLPMMTFPRASTLEINYYAITIPLPLVSILTVILIPLLRPAMLTSSWEGVKQDVFSQKSTLDSVQDTDAPK